jgi:hypothetical protein
VSAFFWILAGAVAAELVGYGLARLERRRRPDDIDWENAS